MMGVLGTAHTIIFVPVMRAAVSEDIEKAVVAHEYHANHSSPTREEFSLILRQLNRIEARLDKHK
jgi:hypothetical protein